MQFIKNGPDIPEPLLQAHEDGRVVLFCGAGVSSPAGLPGFDGLVDKLYIHLGEVPSSVEQAAIDKEQFDTAIGLLEGRIAGGRTIVREQLSSILTPSDLSAPQATATHKALLSLSRNREGHYRLITTNFDRLFEEVIDKQFLQIPKYAAPLLPVPKKRWDGLVYLHGLLPATPKCSDLDCLIVSSGDFGLAYLTERWAARFVSELFRNYKICFVGYSINDPILRYMMDALAADQLRGEDTCEVFAFGSYSKGHEAETANEWRAKNVTPILYDAHRKHINLHRTLREWAITYSTGVLGKERIVTQYAMAKPLASTRQDDFVGRMLWALSDPCGLPAKRFAELEPTPPLNWLEPLADNRFCREDLPRFGIQPSAEKDDKPTFSLISRPTPYPLAPLMTMVYRNPFIFNQWDKVMYQLARWLTKHLNDSKLILWVAKQGGALHAQFAWLIERTLAESPPTPLMLTLWRIVLSGRLVQNHVSQFGLFDWCRHFKREGLTSTLRLQLRDLLTPRVRLREPFRGMQEDDSKEETIKTRITDLVDWEIVLDTDHIHLALVDLAKNDNWHEALPDLLSDATNLLRDTFDMMFELGGADDRNDMSYIHQPSISKHPQNRGFRTWTALIDLARDAWLATVAKFPERARMEVERWRCIPYPIFRRLTFFAATNATLFPPQQALEWLLDEDRWWLWSVETEREALRLLVSLSPRLDAQGREIMECAILKGPPREMFQDKIEQKNLQQIIDREIWLRLEKFRDAGALLSVCAFDKLQELSKQYPKWRLADDERDEFPMWMGDGEDLRKFIATPKDYHNLVNWLLEHPKSDIWQEDDWRERCKRDFRQTAIALIRLARRGEWLIDRWREALQVWSDETLALRSWHYMRSELAIAPDDIVKELAHPLSWWLQAISKTFSRNEETFFLLIRRVLALHRNEDTPPDHDPVFKAINHPVGHVTEAALQWWYRQSLEDNQGLPDDIKPIFTDLCETNIASFRHGRLLLATRVIALFRVDGEWARQYLLPLFEWQRSVIEARSAWEGFLWSPRLYRPLMEDIKHQFLSTAQHYEHLGNHGQQYAALLTFAALEPGNTFSRTELAAATRSLPAEGLHEAAQALVRALEGAGEQKTEYWVNRILPYLKSIWPKARENITPAISESFARLCIAAKDDFPQAMRELKRWLQPLNHPDIAVNLLHEANICIRFPEESLAFLSIIIGENAQWSPDNLKDCLDAIRDAQHGLENDERFERLREYLRRHDISR